MKMRVYLVFIIFILLFIITSAYAQEIQVPMDEKGKIQHIDRKLGKKLDLFTNYNGFSEARLYKSSEEQFVLEVLYKPGENVMRDRVPMSLEEVKAFRTGDIMTIASMLGGAVGLGIGNKIVKGKDFTTGQGALVILGEFLGGVFGTGVALLGPGGSPLLFSIASSLGAVGGLYLTYSMFSEQAVDAHGLSSWELDLDMSGLLAYYTSRNSDNDMPNLPIVGVTVKF